MLLSRNIAYGGILLALILSFITAAYFSPVADFALYALSSLCIIVMVIKGGFRSALILYCASSILIFVVFGLLYFLPFLAFFGIYPIVKGIIEEKTDKMTSFFIKFLIFTLFMITGILIVLFLFDGTALLQSASSLIKAIGNYAYLVIGAVGVAAMMIYDHALTLSIVVIGKFLTVNDRR